MKIRLESFERVAVLLVRQTVGSEDVRILIAGVSKLTGLGRPWVIVDLEHAVLDEFSALLLSQAIARLNAENPGPVQICWVGGPPHFCKFEDLPTALEKLKFKELKELSTKVELEVNRDSLIRLIEARERVQARLGPEGETVAELEATFSDLNRNLRAAQTHLINRLLDPVFGDLPLEPQLGIPTLDEIRQDLGLPPRASGELAEPASTTLPEPDAVLLYAAADLKDVISSLRAEIKALQDRVAKPFLDGAADRVVSLFLENDALRERIREVKGAWLGQLARDSVMTEPDYILGFKSILENYKASLKAKTQGEAA